MPSPFPGMDPWLEAPVGGGGVHTGLIVAYQAALNRVLPPGVFPRIDEYVSVRDEDEDEPGLRNPDVFIPDDPGRTRGGVGVAPAVTAPTARGTLPAAERRKHRAVQIVTTDGHEVLTVLELLSPKNKSGDGRLAYTQKRREYLSSVNLVEIDLLRAGGRFPMGRPSPPTADYYVFSCRRSEYPGTETWAFTVRDPLPVIPVPVSSDHPDAPLDLRAALDRVYDETRSGESLKYAIPPVPPLHAADAAWAADLLKKHAKKRKT